MKSTLFQVAIIAYAIGALVCFGPASVEEDALEAAKQMECEANRREVNVYLCKSWARNDFRPLLKTMFWPLWLSYRIADNNPIPAGRTSK